MHAHDLQNVEVLLRSMKQLSFTTIVLSGMPPTNCYNMLTYRQNIVCDQIRNIVTYESQNKWETDIFPHVSRKMYEVEILLLLIIMYTCCPITNYKQTQWVLSGERMETNTGYINNFN